jgi:hypothetical protein
MRRRLLLGSAVVFVAANLVPVSRTNPVRAVLERSCYDCHSHATRWPWYSWVAPASWLVARDVREAREHLNLSTWGRYDREQRAEHREQIAEVLEEGEMPPWFYLPLHPDARLSDADLAAVRAWTGDRSGGRGHEHHHHQHHHR